jgi:hypothetical protein
MRLTRLSGLCGLALAASLVATPAGADTVLLNDGGMVTGEVQGGEVSVTTADGTKQVSFGDLQAISLDRTGGDVLRAKKGSAMVGRVESPTWAVKLPYGQTVVFPRTQVLQIIFSGR